MVMSGSSRLSNPDLLLAENIQLTFQVVALRKALVVIRKGLSEGPDGEFWSARQWLDKRDIYHGDLSGYRVLSLVANTALK